MVPLATCFLAALLAAAGAADAQVAAGTVSSQVLHRVDPEVPRGAGTAAGPVSCKVLFEVGAEGTPAGISVTGCDEPYRGAAEAAAWQWRFQPAFVEGRAQPYQYSARLTFQRSAGGSVRQELETPTDGSASPIRIVRKVEPELTDQLRAMSRGAGEIQCRVRIRVGADGVPTSADVEAAPEWLRDDLVRAALQWRFEPVVVQGVPTPFSYVWSLTYQAL